MAVNQPGNGQWRMIRGHPVFIRAKNAGAEMRKDAGRTFIPDGGGGWKARPLDAIGEAGRELSAALKGGSGLGKGTDAAVDRGMSGKGMGELSAVGETGGVRAKIQSLGWSKVSGTSKPLGEQFGKNMFTDVYHNPAHPSVELRHVHREKPMTFPGARKFPKGQVDHRLELHTR